MKAKLPAALFLELILCAAVLAQAYTIRVAYHSNSRASYSLDAARMEAVPAGTTPQVSGRHNRIG